MGARKDLLVSYSRLTREEVEAFYVEWGIGLKYNLVTQGCDKFVDQCPPRSIALHCRHFKFSNLRHPFSIFVLNVLEYYRVSFGQIHPQGLARVLHFEVLCRASGYDPSLLSFRRFFRLAKNGNWFTFETSKVDTCLVSSMVTTLVLLGISKLWDNPEQDPVLTRSGQDFVKSDDTSDVAFTDAEAASGDDAVVRGSEHRFEDTGYVSVPNVKGFIKTAAPKTSTCRSARRMLKGAPQSTSYHVDLSDDIESAGKKAMVTSVQGSPRKDIEGLSRIRFMSPIGGVKVADSFKDANVCADVLANFAPPGVRGFISEMEGDTMLSRLILSSCNLSALVDEGVTRFYKGVQEYDEFSKKKEKMKASMAAMKKDIDGSAKKGRILGEKDRLQLKADREALDVQKKAFAEEKEGLKASVVQATGDNQWLIELGFQQHLGLVARFKLHVLGQAFEQYPLFRPEASEILKESVHRMERLTYPYVSEVFSCFGKPLSMLQGLKLAGINEKVCSEVLESLSKKRSRLGDSEETFSEDADVSKEAILEGSAVAGDGGKKAKKAKKAKKGKGDGTRASKPSSDV
ncbi:hypothetical protein Hanom_Chr10g00891391 [Helianthus anomalus]